MPGKTEVRRLFNVRPSTHETDRLQTNQIRSDQMDHPDHLCRVPRCFGSVQYGHNPGHIVTTCMYRYRGSHPATSTSSYFGAERSLTYNNDPQSCVRSNP